VRRNVVTPSAGDGHDRRLERLVGERLDFPAVVADEVVVMVAPRVGALEAVDAVTEVDPLDETEPIEAVERAIDAGDSDSGALSPYAVVNLLRREATVLAPQELDDHPPRPAAPSGRFP